MTYATLKLTIENGLARIRFTRPDLLNRFDNPLHNDFTRALLELLPNQDIRALIISGEGKAFSAGGDMEMMLKMKEDQRLRDRMTEEAKLLYETLNNLPVPTIAAVHGAAVGLGATVALSCDIIVASRDVKLSDPHVVLGLVAGDGGIVSWSRAIGMTRAKRYLLTGDRITGAEAYAMGLVTDLVDTPEQVEPAAEALAKKILALPHYGIRGTKRAFAALSANYAGSVVELGLAYENQNFFGEEVSAAVKAALKR